MSQRRAPLPPSPPRSSSSAAAARGVAVAPLAPIHLSAAARLQRSARLAGQPVFGDGTGVSEATAAACERAHGAFGFVAVDEDERDEEDEEEGGGVVGVVVAQREQEQEDQAAIVVLLTLSTRADRRRQGIGRLLVGALESEARKEDGKGRVSRVVVDVARDNAPALAALTAAGFQFAGGGGGERRRRRSKTSSAAAVLEGVLELE
jgi:GNAT superfamily N-acetyltransferase